MGYDSLILDHDGVVVRTLAESYREELFHEQLAEQFAMAGIEFPNSELLTVLNDSPSFDAVHSLAEKASVEAPELWRCRDDAMAATLLAAMADGSKVPYDDAHVLEEIDLPLGIVSNNQRRIIESILEEHGLFEQFGTIQAREPTVSSLPKKKPSPEMLETAMEALSADEPLFVGDRESEIIAGKRAGVDVAFIRRSHNRGVSLDEEPEYTVGNLHKVIDLVEEC